MWGVAVLDYVRLELAIVLFFSSSIDVLSHLFDITLCCEDEALARVVNIGLAHG